MRPIEITKNGKVVSRSQNLRGLIAYAGKHLLDRVSIWRTADGGAYYIAFSDGAEVRGTFADYSVLTGFILRRVNRWDILQTAHWPDSRAWCAHPGSARAQPRNRVAADA